MFIFKFSYDSSPILQRAIVAIVNNEIVLTKYYTFLAIVLLFIYLFIKSFYLSVVHTHCYISVRCAM